MSEVALKVENIGKKYNLLHKNKAGEGTLVGAFAGGLKNIFNSVKVSQTKEEFWALKDVSFEINQGDRLGVIGRNGAGKSTLLKILSRIVKPTTGRITFEGRMTSLLEVGTGFHGDLSGRENIYLNGSIMGMTKREIDAKFDEIVDFSEVEKFLDTPVKKYSSGMYVRLAFAVAAHLNSDILIVDEVLAVGDASFQKKSLEKMENVSQQVGKTILFVSHNMGQVSALCNKGLLLKDGHVAHEGKIQSIISNYFDGQTEQSNSVSDIRYPQNLEKELIISRIQLLDENHIPTHSFPHDAPLKIAVEIQKNSALKDVLLGIFFTDAMERKVFTTQLAISDKFGVESTKTFFLTIPKSTFVANTFKFSVGLHIPNIQIIDEKPNAVKFDVYDNGSELFKYAGTDVGVVFVKYQWEY
jgi:lipopolysaccharide transport system ATP-binding protein